MSGLQNNVAKRQFLLERLLDAVKQCQIRFGGRKEIASDSDSRVTCLCAQFESVLQHGLKRTRGLALTAAAIKQAAGFSSKTEMEAIFWYYVKDVLNKHELQRFYSLKNITTDVGRGRAWLRCALNEHSLERYFHMLLADKNQLSVFYEDWSFMMDEERSSMIPTMAAGLNSILFAINIDNKDLNGQSKCPPTVSNLLKESTQNVTSLLKESTQGVSSLLKEITASSPVSILIKPEQDADPLPILSKSVSSELKYRKERIKKKKKITNIILFDEDDDQSIGNVLRATVVGGNSEQSSDRSLSSPSVDSLTNLNGDQSVPLLKNNSVHLNGECTFPKLDVKSIDDEDVEENEETYSGMSGTQNVREGIEYRTKSSEGMMSSSLDCAWTSLKILNDDSDELFPFTTAACKIMVSTNVLIFPQNWLREVLNGIIGVTIDQDGVLISVDQLQRNRTQKVDAKDPLEENTVNHLLPSTSVSESMTVAELRQASMAMMNRKHELEEQNSSLRNLLDGEMEHSAILRQETDSLKKKVLEQEELYKAKIQALARENEVLKVQLKKYVGAVQMLKREGQTVDVLTSLWNTESELTIPEQKQAENDEELANSYERKLVEVAEMHGELIEFNERLHRALMAKEALVAQMRQELIDLRGPPLLLSSSNESLNQLNRVCATKRKKFLEENDNSFQKDSGLFFDEPTSRIQVPGDLSQTSEDQSLSDFEISNRALINVWIPSVFLRGKTANAFHVYQVYVRIKDDEWNVYRRYTEFRSLHYKLQAKHPQVRSFNFPPKKAIGNKDAKFVEERRKQLQNYLRNVMNKLIQALPEFAANPKKETLIQLIPFFVDFQPAGESAREAGGRPRGAARFPRLSQQHPRETRNLEPQSGDL